MQESVQNQDQVLIPEPVQSPVYSPPLVSNYGPVSSPVLACPNPVASPPMVDQLTPVYSPELVPIPVQASHPAGPVCITPPVMPAHVTSPHVAINPVPMFRPPVVMPPVPVFNPEVVFIPRPVINAEPVCHPLLQYSHVPVGGSGLVYSGPVCNPVVGSNPVIVERPSSNGSSSSGSSSISIGITITCPIQSLVGQSLTSGLTQDQLQILNPTAPAFVTPQPSGTNSVSFGNSEPVERWPARSPVTIVEVSQREGSHVIIEAPRSEVTEAPRSDSGSSPANAACVAANQEVPQVVRLGELPDAICVDEKVSAAIRHNETSKHRAHLSTSGQQSSGETRPEQNKVAVDQSKLNSKSSVFVPDKGQHAANKKQQSVTDKGKKSANKKQQQSASSCSKESTHTSPSGDQATSSYSKQNVKCKNSRFVPMRRLPDVGDEFDDSFMLLEYLPKLTSLLPRDKRLYLHAYRLLREAIMKIPTIDFTNQTFVIENTMINLSASERLYILSMGGCLRFVKAYAEVFRDHDVLEKFARREEQMGEIAARSKGTEAEVKMEHKGMVTDDIIMTTSGTSAMVDCKDSSVDTQDLELQVVEKHRFLMKKLALLKNRLAHEKMRNKALKGKSEKELKELKDKHNKKTAKIGEMSRELKTSADGGLKLQLQISKAQNKHGKEKISESQLVKKRLIQELGEKTSKLIFLEQYMKAEALRKANLVEVNKCTCTQQDNVVQANQGKQDLHVGSREKKILERVQRAEIQILTIEYEKRKEEVNEMLEKGEYTYGIFDVGLNISSPEKAWLKGQWTNYQDRVKRHLAMLKDMVENHRNIIESSHKPNDILAITMPSIEHFTILCQVSANSPSDIHFVVAPPCQSNHSIAAVISSSPAEQTSSVKAEHSPGCQLPAMVSESGSSGNMPILASKVDESSTSKDMPDSSHSKNQGSALRTEQRSPARNLTSNVKMLDRSPGNTSRRSRRLPLRKLGVHPESSTPHDACKAQGTHNCFKDSVDKHLTDNKNVDETLESIKQQLPRITSLSRSSAQRFDESLVSNHVKLPQTTPPGQSSTQKCHETLKSIKKQLPRTTSTRRSSAQRFDESLVSNVQLPQTTPPGRSSAQVSKQQQQDQLREMIIQESNKLQDPQSGDLEFLLESCWQLASLTLPSDNVNVSRSGVNQQRVADESRQAVSTPVGLSLPTEVSCMKTTDSLSEENYTAIKAVAPSSEINRTATCDSTSSISKTQLQNVKKTDKRASITCVVHKEQESDDTFEANRKTKANVASRGTSDTNVLEEVDGAIFNGSSSSKASLPKEVGLDLSTTASFDTGIGDCSSGSEPSDPVTYHTDSVNQAGGGDAPKQYIDAAFCEQDMVADEKLYTLSTDEVISVDASGYKMSERKYLYHNDSESSHFESSLWNDFNDEISVQLNKEQSCINVAPAIQGGVGSGDVGGEAKHRNEELTSVFLPAYAGGDASSSVSGNPNDKEQTQGKQVVSDPFLPQWAKDFSEL